MLPIETSFFEQMTQILAEQIPSGSIALTDGKGKVTA